MHRRDIFVLVLTVAAMTLAVACSKHPAPITATIAPQPAPQPAVADAGRLGTATPATTYTDAQIVSLLDEMNADDSMTAAVAINKATNEDVKNFARDMMSDHHGLRRDGQDLVKTLNLIPQFPTTDPVQQLARKEIDVLQATPAGSNFNQVYIEQEITLHQQVLQLTTELRAQAKEQALKDLLDKASGVFLKHLGAAQTLQQKLATT